MQNRMTMPSAVLAIAISVMASGCTTVGPNYEGPPHLAAAAPGPMVRATPRGMLSRAPTVSHWWESLGDATLIELVEQALADSPDMQAAQARLRESRATLAHQKASTAPSGSATAVGIDIRTAPGTSDSQSERLYSVGFDASWELDLFGGNRRKTEAARAESEQVQAKYADAQVSLAAEVVQAYTELRANQQRVLLLREGEDLERRALTLIQQRQARGVVGGQEVDKQTSRLEESQRGLQEGKRDVSETLDRLAVLCGLAPGALDARLSVPVAIPAVPNEVMVGDVTALMRNRPDIRAAERSLAASTARIGEAKADYFPKLSLMGFLGSSSTKPGDLLDRRNVSLLTLPSLSWDFLDFRRTTASVHQAEASRDEAVAEYKSTVLQALRDANVALTRYGQQRQSVASLLTQQATAEHNLSLVSQRVTVGAADQLELLDAKRQVVDAREQSLAAQASLLGDFASLHKSLGLGWRVEGS